MTASSDDSLLTPGRALLLVGVLVLVGLLLPPPPKEEAGPPPLPPNPVTLGMSPEQVAERLGQPQPASAFDADAPRQSWDYGRHQVIYGRGQVVGWWNAPGEPLHFHIRDPDPTAAGIDHRTTRDELHRVMGTPAALWFSVEDGPIYEYGYSSLLFDRDGTLLTWSNLGGELKLNLPAATPGAPPVRPGSSVEELLAAMGPPVKWANPSRGELWYYGSSDRNYLRLDGERRVLEWRDRDDILRVTIGEREPGAPPFGPGATPSEVVAAMGTPDGYHEEGLPAWTYGSARVEFEEGKVVRWEDPEGLLRTRPGTR